jgi:universal stress protein A
MPADVEEEFVKRARDDVAALAKTMGVPDARQTVTVGSVKHAILDYVEEEGCDLIVIGTHGRHGLAVLIGSTPNAVLHGTPCDVMCVRVGD